ncbi:AraC family transcriptional regulator [Ancylobacter lacus]|uniref:AraC family transcriptional regulator n=1 Tax=Ancylobacter lacus TaxID=2579970 RepID=UPI001BCD4943|nr:AraC family transcriptional regulator [Ancylobacter lacus]MBS7538019.1 AraC family transcriptional regulator [Ancylobacter lacus]
MLDLVSPPIPAATAGGLASLAGRLTRGFARFGRETPVPGLMVTRADAPSGLIHAVYEPSFCLVVQGRKASMLGESVLTYAAGQCLLAMVDVPVSVRITEASAERPYLALSLSIDPAMVAELLVEQGERLDSGAGFAALRVAELDPRLCDPLARLLDLLEAPEDLPVLGPLIRREIVWRLLGGPLGGTLRQIGLRDTHAARIGRAAAWIRAHYAAPLRVADLAALAHMSPASFHRHFKAVTTLSPVQFQKQVRLQEARRRLMAHEEVASVGYAIGYESPSQFSRDYRRLFGTPPGRDGAAMRASLAAGAA